MTSDSLLKVIWRGRWIMLIGLVLSLAAGFVYIQTATPIYTSTAKLYLDYSGIRIAPSYESDRVPRTDRYLYTQAERLVSQPILKAVLTLPEIQRLQTFADAPIRMAYLRNNVEVEVGRRDEIISVSFSSPYAPEVPQIVNAIVEAYIASRSESQREDSSQVFDRYQKEYDRATQELDQTRDELEQFQAASMPLTLGSDQGNGVDARYRELETEFAQAQLRTVDAELFFNAVRLLADDPEALRQYVALAGHVAAYAGGGNTTAQLEAEQASVESELESLLVELTADHPRVVSLQARIKQIKATIAESNDRFVRVQLAAAEQRYLEAKACEEDLAGRCEEQRQKVRQMNDEISKYRRLATEVAELTAYRQMTGEQLKEIRTIAGEEVGGFRMQILESASTSEFPSHPQRGKVMAIALALGLLAGGGLAVLRDLTDQTLRSGEEISSV
ncbi:MAG TPA: Wzz/FepE/Etk N-terminal domain-containing protein, partial [Sedimentisphaerales bacterium]|nr:Wzz/FepE/Etk N-terminal domain-containing protein [Sedimentisphaerales bacterium]